MKLLIDMNLAPRWVGFLTAAGFEAVHWSTVGDPRASDLVVMAWARDRSHVVFTNDLDFSALIATAGAVGPSVLQVRSQDVLPEAIGSDVLRVLREHQQALESGAIVTVDEVASRVRILPVRQGRLPS